MGTSFSKIARYYLFLLGFAYIWIGFSAITLGIFGGHSPSFVPDIVYYGVVLVLSGWFVIPTPFVGQLISQGGLHTPTGAMFSLGLVAVVLSIVAIFALIKMRKDFRWIYVWYFLSTLAFVFATWNFVANERLNYVTQRIFAHLYEAGFLSVCVTLLATHLVHRGLMVGGEKMR